MSGDDLVAEARGEQQVGWVEPRFSNQPRAELAAEFLVVGEVQRLDCAVQRCPATSGARVAKV